jgi:selenide,water dikinase
MATLNRDAAEVMKRYPVRACTDITGFGFLGHLAEMVQDSRLGLQIHPGRIPILPETLNYAGMGLLPAGAFKNREFYEGFVEMAPSVDRLLQDVLFDPQTSGGLLISLEGSDADDLLRELTEKGIRDAAIVGEVVSEPKGKILVG